MGANLSSPCGVYPGTFDPPTLGHVDIIHRALGLFPRVVVGVSPNPKKGPLFDVKERIALLQEATAGLPNLTVLPFDGLMVDFARRVGGTVIVRGIRTASDMAFEFQMAMMNRRLSGGMETVFLMPGEHHTYITSSLIREVARCGGSVSGLVPPCVAARLKGERFA